MTEQMADDLQAHQLALMIKRSHPGRAWCATRPLTIARYLLAHGVTIPHPPIESREDQ